MDLRHVFLGGVDRGQAVVAGETGGIDEHLGQLGDEEGASQAGLERRLELVAAVRQLGGNELLIVGLSEGTSNLLIFDARGRHQSWDVTVGSGDLQAIEASPLKQLLRDSPEATLRIVGDRIVVDGLIRNPSELKMLADYPDVVVLAKLDPRVVDRRVLEINTEHALVKRLDASASFDDLAHVLFDQAVIAEGGQLEDPAAYVKRVNAMLVAG